jgi:GGDEF domain-containing protein
MRFNLHLLISIGFLLISGFSVSSWSQVNPCPAPSLKNIEQTPRQFAEILCAQAKLATHDHPLSASFQDCGTGSRSGMSSNAKDVRDSYRLMAHDVPDLVTKSHASLSEEILKASGNPIQEISKLANAQTASSLISVRNINRQLELSGKVFKEVIKQSYLGVDRGLSAMACMPWAIKLEQACFLTEKITSDLVIAGMDAGAPEKISESISALVKFRRAANATPELRGASLAEQLKHSAHALGEKSTSYTTLFRAGQFNVLSRPDKVNGSTRFFIEEFYTANGRRLSDLYEIPTDAKTQALDSNTGAGKKFAQVMAQQQKGNYLIFGDVMDLGKVNYFKGGTQAGDKYLEHVAKALRTSMRPADGDLLFKNGGDELVVLLKSNNPVAVQKFEARVQQALKSDTELQSLFADERKLRNDPAFKLEPGVALGSAKIPETENPWNEALNSAETKAACAKATLKAARGEDVSKYNICPP